MSKGNMRFAIEQLLNDIAEGVADNETLLARWHEARGDDEIVSCTNDSVVVTNACEFCVTTQVKS